MCQHQHGAAHLSDCAILPIAPHAFPESILVPVRICGVRVNTGFILNQDLPCSGSSSGAGLWRVRTAGVLARVQQWHSVANESTDLHAVPVHLAS